MGGAAAALGKQLQEQHGTAKAGKTTPGLAAQQFAQAKMQGYGAVDADQAEALTQRLSGHVHYHWGGKIRPTTSVDAILGDPKKYGSIDCSGYVRWLVYQTSGGALQLGEGSIQIGKDLERLAQKGVVTKCGYEDAGKQDGVMRIAGFDHGGDHRHVWGVVNGETMESRGGQNHIGVSRQPWRVYARSKAWCYALPTSHSHALQAAHDPALPHAAHANIGQAGHGAAHLAQLKIQQAHVAGHIDTDEAIALTARLRGHVGYGWGSKLSPNTDIETILKNPQKYKQIDCSGYVTWLVRQTSGGSIPLSGGSIQIGNQLHGLAQKGVVTQCSYADAGKRDGVMRIAGFNHGGRHQHVWAVVNGETLESHGGKGVDRLPWAHYAPRTQWCYALPSHSHAGGDTDGPALHPAHHENGAVAGQAAPLLRGKVTKHGQQAGLLTGVSHWQPFIDEAAAKYGVDHNLIATVIQIESRGNPNAKSHVGALGLMQLMPAVATELGVHHPLDPRENIMGGTKLLSQLQKRYHGDVALTLAGYNAGPGNVQKYGGLPPFKETRQYVQRGTVLFHNLSDPGAQEAAAHAPRKATGGRQVSVHAAVPTATHAVAGRRGGSDIRRAT